MRKSILTIAALATFTSVAGQANAEEVVINKGDTLWNLSKQHGATVEQLKDWNGLTSDLIKADETLIIAPEEQYTVVPGDTLWSIAEKYNVTVDQIKEWNNLKYELIVDGQKLVIYTEKAPTLNEKPKVEASTTKKQVKDQNPSLKEPAASTTAEKSVEKEKVVKEVTVTATAYTADCEGCIGITKTGVDLKANPDKKVIAVDPKVIPLGSKVYVEGYGYATAEDTGGAIKGKRIDLFIPSEDAALAWGKRQVNVKVLN
ncbi:LysM peptidoglycan-binding and 3D domain-containing protein [Peribacillus acanthi]|uniref:LysM peptidoglycan-binding and 3D domain-containing protein n=1 Tax=Peribacillus acanthi TaxID=2171554 RepID=UPI000D3EABC3|nr:3D domain-containing protein [Peribacillus acanthi]